MTLTKPDKPYFQFLLLSHYAARTFGYFESKTEELNHFLNRPPQKKIKLQKGRECKTIHNLICKIQFTLIYKCLFTLFYIHSRQTQLSFCAHVDLKRPCEQYDLLPHLFDFWKIKWQHGVRREKKIKYYWSGKIIQVCKEQKEKNVEFCLLKHPGHYGLLTNNEYT